jgi:hypothetical protein
VEKCGKAGKPLGGVQRVRRGLRGSGFQRVEADVEDGEELNEEEVEEAGEREPDDE